MMKSMRIGLSLTGKRLTHRHVAAVLVATTTLGMAMPAVAETLKLAGTGSGLGTMKVLAEAYKKHSPAFNLVILPNLGSGGGMKALTVGAIDIAVISRPIKSEESALGLVGIEYGRTPFVLATNLAGISSLSLAQTAEILGGKVTQWPDGTPIRLVLRPKSDIDTELLGAWSPQVGAALKVAHAREGMVVAPTDQDSASQIERLHGAIGTSTLALIMSEGRKIHALPLEGVAPSAKSISDKSYPHYKSMILVTKTKHSDIADKFVQFALSAEGRAILQKLGHWIPAVAAN
jgi:phosphate transport system substrate-binding protein